MSGTLLLFSSRLERDAAFPEGVPAGLPHAIAGIGLVDAALGTARAVAEASPDAILFLGTCGAHRGAEIAVGDIILADDVRIGSGDVASGRMRIPSLLKSTLRADDLLAEAVIEAASEQGFTPLPRRASVSCTLGITENDDLAERLRAYDGSETENLEAFSLLAAAGGIPTAILLGVTNIVGAEGGRGWVANYGRMMRRVGSLALLAPRSRRPGAPSRQEEVVQNREI